tara:strand:- start:5075 stop:6859 length:1785 start_codon:yes stop_codon:yes gene_type:complete
MADALQTYVSVCAGGLVTNVDPLTQSNSLSGSAVRLINMEPSLEGGYRRISGYANSYDTLPGTGKVLGLAVNGEINQGVLGCRKPSSGNNYLHWYNHYYDVALGSGQGSGFSVGETVTGVVSSGDATVVVAAGTVISKTANALVINFGKLPSNIFATGNVLTGGTSTATGTVASTPTVKGWQAVSSAGSPTMTGVDVVRFERYNWTEEILLLTDGINPAAKYNGTTYTQITHTNAPNNPKFASAFANHLWLAGDPDEPFNIYFSSPNADTDFDPANGAGVINIGFTITQLKSFRNQLYVFGQNQIKRIVGDNYSNFSVENVTNDLGCVAPDTVVEFGGDIIFLGPDGVRPISGTSRIGDVELETVSREIQKTFENYTANEDVTKLKALVIRRKSQFRLFFEANTSLSLLAAIRKSSSAQSTFEYSQLVGIEATAVASGYVGQFEFVLHGDTTGKVFKQEEGNSFGGSDVLSVYQTPFYFMGDPELRKIFYRVKTFLKSEGATSISVGIEYNFGDSEIATPPNFELSTAGAASFFDASSTLYDETDVYDGNPTPIRTTNISGSGDSISIAYVTNGTNPSHTIQAVSILYGAGDRR